MNKDQVQRHLKHLSTEFDMSFASKFPIGDPILIESHGKKYHSTLRGVLFGKYILTDIPQPNEKLPPIDYNSRLMLRFMLSGKMYGFTSYIIRNHSIPPLLVLEYPEAISQLDLRASERMHMIIPVRLSTIEESSESQGAILDLSEDGALVATDSVPGLTKECEVSLHVLLPGEGKELLVAGSVKNIKVSNKKTLIGIMFTRDRNTSLDKMKRFYLNCLSYQQRTGDQ